MVAKQTTPAPQSGSAGKSGSTPARPKPAAAGGPARGGGATTTRRMSTPSIATFFQESRAELRKVTWPTRQETLNLTGAVIAMTVSIAAFLGAIDFVLNAAVKLILNGH